jgi:RNA polymerase sigma factor (sigma-70 family)
VAFVAQADSTTAQTLAPQPFAPRSGPEAFDGFVPFYRDSYREVVKRAMIAGATPEEAEDAASKTFLDMLQRWPVDGFPLMYARTAVVTNFIKDKTRGNRRVARRLIERGPASLHREGTEDAELSSLEGHDWVADVLSQLTPAQREVMERIARGLTNEEITADLGKSQDVVRRRLCDARGRLVQILNPDGSTAGESRPATERPPREESP